ncbi:MAG: single-stranded-DNA-specific exonuclease RecJ [Candidatus Omnitrophica bacterium]|nr:single-stranded-DNA-specific exonuclease RecJ [Candidatus Omnitrophota bacterium]
MGADAEAYLPHRMEEGYGLNQDSLGRLLSRGRFLLVTVDNGITGFGPIQFLKEKGVDTIIVDHHTPKDKMPPAFAIVSAATGEGGDANLAACGLAFKLGWALVERFDEVKDYLDLVTVGTVADLAPVLGDNRILLRHGLVALAKTQRTGLRALMDSAKIAKEGVSYRDIAFGIGPRINAAGRMGSPENAYKLLTTSDKEEARRLAALLEEGNRDRQRAESDAFQEAAEHVERTGPAEDDRILVVNSPGWHEGVLGIVAARLVERYQRPSIVISMKESGVGKGSGRSVSLFSLFDCVLACEDLLENFGGHAQACGLTIKEENISPFRRRLNAVAAGMSGTFQGAEEAVEAELPLSAIDVKFLNDLEKLSPFGPGNKKPLFLSRGVRLKSAPKKRGRDTLQCWVSDETGKTTCEAVGFRAFGRWNADPRRTLDIIHQPTLKNFRGITSIQLELEDWL